MPSQPDHSWISAVLADITTYAELHHLPKVAALVFTVRGAVSHILNDEVDDGDTTNGTVEKSFSVVLNEFAGYCQAHGLTETEGHVSAALEAWTRERDISRAVGELAALKNVN